MKYGYDSLCSQFKKMKEQIISFLKKKLDKKRFIHSLNVADTAKKLAGRNNIPEEKAEIAGLLHDISRFYSNKQLLKQGISRGLNIDACERRNPKLLHSYISARIAAEKFAIKDKEIISAIEKHTTGDSNMSSLDKIIYVADYIEPSRDLNKDYLHKLEKLAFEDLDQAFFEILEATLQYLIKNGMEVHPRSIKLKLALKKKGYSL
jgi:predicted HD superfamily hydrolase involved in NAD metabolism